MHNIWRLNLMTRDEAREVFKNHGLSYEKLMPVDIEQLAHEIGMELVKYKRFGGFHAEQMGMSVAPIRKKDIVFDGGKLKAARIQIDGAYFRRREGITFSQTGFIGFGCEFSDANVEPILKAFCKWCADVVEVNKECDANAQMGWNNSCAN
jgi:hypothetical protein